MNEKKLTDESIITFSCIRTVLMFGIYLKYKRNIYAFLPSSHLKKPRSSDFSGFVSHLRLWVSSCDTIGRFGSRNKKS